MSAPCYILRAAFARGEVITKSFLALTLMITKNKLASEGSPLDSLGMAARAGAAALLVRLIALAAHPDRFGGEPDALSMAWASSAWGELRQETALGVVGGPLPRWLNGSLLR